jgi:hypothetical protein
MIIARQKREENIAEYILYMWQLEDLLRAYELDNDLVDREIVEKFEAPPALKAEIREWYSSIIDAMKSEMIVKNGHLQFLVSLVDDLDDFHFRLIDSPYHSDYQELYTQAVYNIGDFRKRMNFKERISDMEVCLTVLYGYMLMHLKNKPVSEDTQEAIDTIRNLMALFSAKFKSFEQGQLEI